MHRLTDGLFARELPILLTSAIRVAAPLTALSDSSARLAATVRALSRWMAICPSSNFVFCDGSGYDVTGDLQAIPKVDMSRLEVITFQNDHDRVRLLGKGYGEGQIIQYALKNSALLGAANSFVKCTGKLWVDNYWQCRHAYNGTAGFSHFGFMSVHAVDTRFFIVRKDFFESKLARSYESCDDPKGKYLEDIYRDALRGTAHKNWMLSVYPHIRGISGTSGEEFRGGNLKRLGKNLAIHYLRLRR